MSHDSRQQNGQTARGGLDRYLGPTGAAQANMPEPLIDEKVGRDEPVDNETSHEAASPEEAARRLERMAGPPQPGDGLESERPPARTSDS